MSEDIYRVIMVGLTVLGSAFACFQLWQIKVNRKKQFEQSRRDKTVQLVFHYANEINSSTRMTEKVVAQLSDEQCQDLYNCTSFEVDGKIKEQLCKVCPYKQLCDTRKEPERPICQKEDGRFMVENELLMTLRRDVIKYLNTLEGILLAWQLGIVDQEALVEQFAFLDKKRQKERALETFRMIAGNGKSYPATELFYQYLDKKNREEAQKSLKDTLK